LRMLFSVRNNESTARSNHMRSKGGILLTLFGAVFFAVGAGMGFFSILSMQKAQKMLYWNECPAKILSCELKSHRGDKGSVSYSVHARYEYEVNGVKYQNDRVALSTGADNIGSFQSDTHRLLEKSRSAEQPMSCWVNPENAADSILFRRPRIPLLMFKALFVLVFGSIGLAIALSGLFMVLMPDTSSVNFHQPSIRMRGVASHKVAVAVAVYWNAFTLWMTWKALIIFGTAEIPLYFWGFTASGFISAMIAGYMFLKLNKYGISFFEMAPLPGVLGGPVSGSIRIPKQVEAESGFELTLQCIYQYTTRSGKNSSTHREVLWDESCHVDTVYNYGTEMVLPVKFAVPYNKPATSAPGNSNGHYWQLKARAKTPGIDYSAVFDVPVKHTSASIDNYEHAEIPSGVAHGGSRATLEDIVTGLNLKYERSSGGVIDIGFPAFRTKAATAGLFFFTLIWTGACYMIVRSKAPFLFAGVFVFFDLIMIAVLISQIFASALIRIDPYRKKLNLVKCFAGIVYQNREFDFSEMDVFEYEKGMQSGSTCYYRVSVNLVGGRAVKLGGSLDSRSGAMNLADALSKIVNG